MLTTSRLGLMVIGWIFLTSIFLCAQFSSPFFGDQGGDLGNAWHYPPLHEQGLDGTMRSPLEAIPTQDLVLYTGNQFQGKGNAANQTEKKSYLRYKSKDENTWKKAPLKFSSQFGNNKFFKAVIPKSELEGGQIIKYYFEIHYTDRDLSYLCGNDETSQVTSIEELAQEHSYSFSVHSKHMAEGEFTSIISGDFEAKLFHATGHVEFLQASKKGAERIQTILIESPVVKIEGHKRIIGKVTSSQKSANGRSAEIRQEFEQQEIKTRLSCSYDGILTYEVVNWEGFEPEEVLLKAQSPSDEAFYGLGEKFNDLNQAGNKVRILTWDPPGDKGDQSYKVAPWFLSSKNYGFYLDSTAESYFDFRKTSPEHIQITNKKGSLKYHFMGGPSPKDALERYTALTGRPSLPPKWVFGPWISSDYWRNGGELRYVVEKYKELGIPASVIVFDSPWATTYNNFRWNEKQFGTGGTYEGVEYKGFADLFELFTYFQKNGLKIVCWMTPFLNTESVDETTKPVPGLDLGKCEYYDYAANSGFLVRSVRNGPPLIAKWWKGQGSAVDFTNPSAAKWFQGILRTFVEESQVVTAGGTRESVIGGFKTDDGETSNGPNTYIPETASYHNGLTGVEMRNAYCVEYHKRVWEILGEEGILFARSGFSGSQAYPAYWSGDNQPNFGEANGLPSVIVAGLSAAMSGFSIWGHDIGGYQDCCYEKDPADLFMRWTQFGAMSPIMQIHRQVATEQQYPWSYGAEALALYKEMSILHTRLFPYLYKYAVESARRGMPIIRPLPLEYPNDLNARNIKHTYLLGPDLLVAPIIEAQSTSRKVYLPKGKWLDYWTSTVHEGGKTIEWSNSNKSTFPLFLREGGIVPLLADCPQTLCSSNFVNDSNLKTPSEDLEVLWFPKKITSKLTLPQELEAPTKAQVSWKVFQVQEPEKLSSKGGNYERLTTREAWNTASEGWFYDPSQQILFLKVQTSKIAEDIIITFKK